MVTSGVKKEVRLPSRWFKLCSCNPKEDNSYTPEVSWGDILRAGGGGVVPQPYKQREEIPPCAPQDRPAATDC